MVTCTTSACFCNSQYLTLGSIILMHSSIPVNIHLIFHDQSNQWALGSTQELHPAQGAGCSWEGSSLSPSAATPPSAGHPGLSSPGGRWQIFSCLALSAPSALSIQPLAWQNTGQSQEAQSWDPDGRAAHTAGSQAVIWRWITSLQCIFSCTSCGFQLHRDQGSWLFLGCLRSKRKQRL